MIYNENNINVTNRFKVIYEENQTVISTNKDIIDNEFYNHDYKFTRKLKLKENNSEFSPNSKKDGRYYIQSPDASIIFLTTYSNSISNTINSDNKSKIDIFNMNIVSKINVECYFDDTLIDRNRCRVDSNKTFLLDQVTQEHIYEMLRISILVPRELKFKTVKIPLSRKKKEIISERENNDWQIEVFISEGIPEDRHCLVSVIQDSPFRYQHEAIKSELKSARLMYKSERTSNMEEYLNVGEGVCINDNDFSLNNGNYKTTWTQKSGLLFNYRETLTRPFYVKPYTSNLTFTLNYTL